MTTPRVTDRTPPPLPPRLAELRRQLGARLREIRERQRLTQEQLGERAGVDRKTINRIENGLYSPRLDNLFHIADALDVPPQELFGTCSAPPNE
ncbi:helix-turn-helix transcriptional regulator [Streptosporangium canum]|uniref:helix-turn-helix transcriptional regulator n=1 Tax=Streptosporangium canum TaxID=324952 RepID=UPI0037911242